MKAQTIGRAIGAASLAFGVMDMVLGRRFGRGVGAGEQMGGRLFQVVGAREVATGVAGLLAPASPAPIQWRLAGDIFDLAALGYIAAPSNPRRKTAILALGIVAGVTLVDLLGARALRRTQRHETEREAEEAARVHAIEQRIEEAGRKLDRIEQGLEEDDRTPLDRPGVFAGTAGTGGDNKVQDQLAI